MKVCSLEEVSIASVGRSVWRKCGQVPHYEDVNIEFMLDRFALLMRNGTGRAFGLFDEETEDAVGILFGFIGPDLMTGRKQGTEFLWAVAPQYRSRGVALMLLRAFERQCQFEGCERILCGSAAWSEPHAMRRLYSSQGYTPHAEAFAKVLNG